MILHLFFPSTSDKCNLLLLPSPPTGDNTVNLLSRAGHRPMPGDDPVSLASHMGTLRTADLDDVK